MSESLNQPEKINTAANQRKTDPEIGEKKTNFLKHPDQILNIIRTTLSSQGLWLFIVPISTYLSFFIIILITFLLFKPSNTSPQNTNQTNQSLTEEQKKQIAEEVNKVITTQQKTSSRQKAVSENPNSILAKGYIDGQIKQEAQEQAEKVVKDEIDKLKADWKGDLFGQISFPMIFAIASIFAAFAVKDILTEILKEQEKEKVKQDIYQELIPKIRENVEHNPHLARRLVAVESYATWLEYRLLDISINQALNELSQISGNDNDVEREQNNTSAVWMLCDRSEIALKRLAPDLTPRQFELLRDSDNKILEAKVKSSGLNESAQNNLLKKLQERSELAREPRKDSESVIGELEPNMDELFRTLMSSLTAKLNELGETGLARDVDNYLSRNIGSEKEKRGKEFEAIWGGQPAKSSNQQGV